MLGHHIFANVGKGVKIGPDVRFRYGYNISIEDNSTICRGVVLDDLQELVLPAGTRVEEGARLPKP
jgi:acetyltransferase-like isoleucine patch superfamily enzyme